MALLAMSALDFGLQKYFYLKQQRMSHEDIRNEYKQSEGDPHMKGHRRRGARNPERSARGAASGGGGGSGRAAGQPDPFCRRALLSSGETPLPRLLFKASDDDAHYLIEQAQRARIPVIRYIWLARTLYRTTPEGGWIPRETLKAVAQVYRLLRELEDHYMDEVIEMEDE